MKNKKELKLGNTNRKELKLEQLDMVNAGRTIYIHKGSTTIVIHI